MMIRAANRLPNGRRPKYNCQGSDFWLLNNIGANVRVACARPR